MYPWYAWLLLGMWVMFWACYAFLRIRRLSHRHKHNHTPVVVYHYGQPTGFVALSGIYNPAPLHTIVLRRCECGDLTTEDIPGKWTIPEVLGEIFVEGVGLIKMKESAPQKIRELSQNPELQKGLKLKTDRNSEPGGRKVRIVNEPAHASPGEGPEGDAQRLHP
jgi:hypothetical protein